MPVGVFTQTTTSAGQCFWASVSTEKVGHYYLQTPTQSSASRAIAYLQERLATPSCSPPNLISGRDPSRNHHSEDRTYHSASPWPTRAEKASASRLLGTGFAFGNKRVLPIRN